MGKGVAIVGTFLGLAAIGGCMRLLGIEPDPPKPYVPPAMPTVTVTAPATTVTQYAPVPTYAPPSSYAPSTSTYTYDYDFDAPNVDGPDRPGEIFKPWRW